MSKILIVDDEEAILETMQFTFEDEYQVLTSNEAARALEILDREAPVAAVITDQRMPNMTGVEFLSRVFERHPETIRIILTGFADMDAIVKAINDGHAYAYIPKPWEPAELKQVVRRAVEHHELERENARLLTALKAANLFTEAVMNRLDVGALGIDRDGVVRQANQLAREYLGVRDDPRGRALKDLLETQKLEAIGAAAVRVASADSERHTEELDVKGREGPLRLRVGVQTLTDPEGGELGRALLLREISHEPARRRVDDLALDIARADGDVREQIVSAIGELRAVAGRAEVRAIQSPGMAELRERASRTLTALENWLAVDAALASEDYPDAQLLLDRMRVATSRWPWPDELPKRVRTLAECVEAYYESGENRKQRVL